MCSSSSQENYLRWDSLGEFLALAVSFEHLSRGLQERRRPRCWPTRSTRPPASSWKTTSRLRRKVGGIDNRGSHFYLALYWAQALAAQNDDAELKALFTPIAEKLTANEKKIVDELIAVQGKPVDIGGYYQPDDAKASAALRPSATFNEILATL